MMTEYKHELLDALQELDAYSKDISGDYGTNHILRAMADVMSEDNLNEVVAAISEKLNYPVGITFWYGDRANFIDRDYWR